MAPGTLPAPLLRVQLAPRTPRPSSHPASLLPVPAAPPLRLPPLALSPWASPAVGAAPGSLPAPLLLVQPAPRAPRSSLLPASSGPAPPPMHLRAAPSSLLPWPPRPMSLAPCIAPAAGEASGTLPAPLAPWSSPPRTPRSSPATGAPPAQRRRRHISRRRLCRWSAFVAGGAPGTLPAPVPSSRPAPRSSLDLAPAAPLPHLLPTQSPLSCARVSFSPPTWVSSHASNLSLNLTHLSTQAWYSVKVWRVMSGACIWRISCSWSG